jgi:DNA polymerase III delta prime subunit
MVYTGGQYYECLERLKYAVHTGKGGVLLCSEEAGLGKTTILLKLIDEMKARYGEAFRYAFIEYPSLTSGQIMAYIASSLIESKNGDGYGSRRLASGPLSNRHHMAHDLKHSNDKLKNITLIKETLTEAKSNGGKSVIIVDEAQMLCGARDILQELRALINLQYGNEYLIPLSFQARSPFGTKYRLYLILAEVTCKILLFPSNLRRDKGLIGLTPKAGLDSGRDYSQQMP